MLLILGGFVLYFFFNMLGGQKSGVSPKLPMESPRNKWKKKQAFIL